MLSLIVFWLAFICLSKEVLETKLLITWFWSNTFLFISSLKSFKIDLENAQKGDLHFFGKKGEISHVGLSCGGYDLIHSQGFVKKESLNENDLNFNKSLSDIYLCSASIRLKFKLWK